MTSPRSKAVRSTVLAHLALAAITLLTACNTGGSEPAATCSGVNPGGSFELVEPGKSVAASCVTFGSYGKPGQSGGYDHEVELLLDGEVRLSFWFSSALTTPMTIDFSSDGEFGAQLFDYNGFEGGPRNFCTNAPGFPPNQVTSGTIVITSLTVGADGFLDDIKAKIDISFTGCSVDAWDLSNLATLTVRGDI